MKYHLLIALRRRWQVHSTGETLCCGFGKTANNQRRVRFQCARNYRANNGIKFTARSKLKSRNDCEWLAAAPVIGAPIDGLGQGVRLPSNSSHAYLARQRICGLADQIAQVADV